MLRTQERHPLYQTVPPGYESVVRTGTHAFATRMTGKGFDVTVPPGTIDGAILFSTIAAIPGELPSRLRIWIVDEDVDVVPADIEVVAHKTVQELVGPADGTCVGARPKKENREAVTLRVTAGTRLETVDVRAQAPHVAIADDIKCRIVRGQP